MDTLSPASEPALLLPENTDPTAYLEKVRGLSAPLAHNRAILDRKYGKEWRENEALLSPIEFRAAFSKPRIGNFRGTTVEQSQEDHRDVVEWAISVGRPVNPEALEAYGLEPQKVVEADTLLVYHGSKEPITGFDPAKQTSGYYPGFYTTTSRQVAEEFGANLVAFKIRRSDFYEIGAGEADNLKRTAAANDFSTSQGSGTGEAAYLKAAGYAGVRRGSEFILFDPTRHERVNPAPALPLALPLSPEVPALGLSQRNY